MQDITKHDTEVTHYKDLSGKMLTHSPDWYEFWGSKCPVCNAPAEFKEAK